MYKVQYIIYKDEGDNERLAMYNVDTGELYYLCDEEEESVECTLGDFLQKYNISNIYELKDKLSEGWFNCIVYEALNSFDYYEILIYSVYNYNNMDFCNKKYKDIFDNDNNFIKIK